MKYVLIVITMLIVSGCATGPSYYEGQQWAQKGFDQASAECYTEINQLGGPPNYYLCMKAKGWIEVSACRRGFPCRTN